MFEKYGLRALNVGRAAFAAISLIALSVALVGCASGSSAQNGADGADEKVSGQPPSPEEDTPKPLPKGPKVDMGSSAADSDADTEQQAGAESDADTEQQAGADFTRSEVQDFMQKGPSYALTLVEVKPARADGKFQGFEIANMKPGAADVVHPLLQTGDVITHINGVRMEKPDDYLTAWKLLSEVNTIRIDFIRDGASEHAVWHIQ